MVSRASKRLGIMKAYGRKFGRKPLERLYLAYIRPILEYGDYIWSNLTKNLCESPRCECGEQNEMIEHYLMDCPLYNRARQDAKNLLPVNAWNCRDLLHGSKIRYDKDTNILLSKTIQKFIIATNRFK